MSKNTNVRRIPKPLLATVDALILDYRKQQAEAELKRLSTNSNQAA